MCTACANEDFYFFRFTMTTKVLGKDGLKEVKCKRFQDWNGAGCNVDYQELKLPPTRRGSMLVKMGKENYDGMHHLKYQPQQSGEENVLDRFQQQR